MDTQQRQYYKDMLHKNRLIPFMDEDKSIFTFSLTNDTAKYLRDDPWEVIEHNPDGRICYIEQCVSNKKTVNPFRAWHYLKEEIIKRFPQVEFIYWVRYKDEQIQRYLYKIKVVKQ